MGDAAQLQDGAPPVDGSTSEVPAQLTAIMPDTAVADTAFTLTITGTGIASGAVAYLDGQLLDTVSAEDTMLIADVPSTATARPGSLAVYVENTPGEATSSSNVLYLTVDPAPGAPVIYDYSPDNGVAGDTVLIIASNLMGQTLDHRRRRRHRDHPRHAVDDQLADAPAPPTPWRSRCRRDRDRPDHGHERHRRVPREDLQRRQQPDPARRARCSPHRASTTPTNWSRALGRRQPALHELLHGERRLRHPASCTMVPWFEITFPEPADGRAHRHARKPRVHVAATTSCAAASRCFGAGDALLFAGRLRPARARSRPRHRAARAGRRRRVGEVLEPRGREHRARLLRARGVRAVTAKARARAVIA